ncbi:unnamed protein product [Euphydryas editha]|uniref:Uncharacterized protein n=1 Tax=Euphydryas editha TaxID=104508 RepID=A0AAU9ULW9_EUPED|nr:unnamed protein product [Euphydryas editha]
MLYSATQYAAFKRLERIQKKIHVALRVRIELTTGGGGDIISTYYKINLFIPFLDHAIQQLIERFTKHRKVISTISGVLPSNFAAGCEIQETFRMYSAVLPEEKSISVVKAELEVWKAAMTLTSPIPKSAPECIDNCDQKLHISKYLHKHRRLIL